MKHFVGLRRWRKKLEIGIFRQVTHFPWSCHICWSYKICHYNAVTLSNALIDISYVRCCKHSVALLVTPLPMYDIAVPPRPTWNADTTYRQYTKTVFIIYYAFINRFWQKSTPTITPSNMISILKNHLLLITKRYIYIARCKGSPLSVRVFNILHGSFGGDHCKAKREAGTSL